MCSYCPTVGVTGGWEKGLENGNLPQLRTSLKKRAASQLSGACYAVLGGFDEH